MFMNMAMASFLLSTRCNGVVLRGMAVSMIFSLVSCSPIQARVDASSTISSISSAPITTTASAAITTLTGTSDADLVPSTVSYTAVSTALSASPTAQPTYPPIPAGLDCAKDDADKSPFPPFCQPLNGSEKNPDERYYVTWDVSAFDGNTTVNIYLDYVNTLPAAGSNAWQSPAVNSAQGFVILETDKAWLQGQRTNYLNMRLVAHSEADGFEQFEGPVISFTNSPADHYPASPHTSSNKLGIFIGIPVGVAMFCLIIGGLFYGMKKHREFNLKDIMARRKGYTGRKSRRQRLGRTGPIKISEREADRRGADYKDDVELQQRNVGHNREPSFGNLVDSPVRGGFADSFSTRGTENAFRNEVERQEKERAAK